VSDREIIERFNIEDCTRCRNECADACPVYRRYGTGHPQQLAHRLLESGAAGIGDHRLLWECVTCAACTEACPYGVRFADFVRELRIGRTGYVPVFEGLVHTFQRMQAEAQARAVLKGKQQGRRRPGRGAGGAPDRLGWVDGSLQTARKGPVALFTGCVPFFDTAFGEACGTRPTEAVRSAVQILNALEVAPVLFEDERCCGRDLYDIGDRDTFRALADHNLDLLKRRGVELLLTICPECAYTIGTTYRDELEEPPCRIEHITTYIARHLDRLDFEAGGERIAFHDPCYLARYQGIIEEPRKLAAALSVEPIVELERSGAAAGCCGMGSWINHGPHTRLAVHERIVDAHRRGAGTLLTACPKCSIVMGEVTPDCSWKPSPVAVRDLLTVAASRLKKD
jgi:Fe-S oxidoreductase